MSVNSKTLFLTPDWPAPATVRAYCTSRRSPTGAGSPAEPYGDFNLALHVGDDRQSVLENRALLQRLLNLKHPPQWLQQVHGKRVVELKQMLMAGQEQEADAAFTRDSDVVCVVQTADCLPLLLCDTRGTVVAAVHAGWRGLQQGIIAQTIRKMNIDAASLLVWLGPAISAAEYEIDQTVYAQFTAQHGRYSEAFESSRRGHWRMDLYAIARIQLRECGVNRIYGGDQCSYRQADTFYSYRRDGQTGRMASLIWLTSP